MMRASVGDHIVIASNEVDRPTRDGEIVELRHADGTPPYVVRWSESGNTGLFFPGTDAHVEHSEAGEGTAGEPATARHVKSWRVQLDLFESGDDTTAHAVLLSETPLRLEADGAARRHPADPSLPLVGDEVAAARALRRLADRLLGTASDDLAAVEGHPVTLRP
jgi:hypothetical protein